MSIRVGDVDHRTRLPLWHPVTPILRRADVCTTFSSTRSQRVCSMIRGSSVARPMSDLSSRSRRDNAGTRMYNGIHFREDPSPWLWMAIIVWGMPVIRMSRGLLSLPYLDESEPSFGCLCADAALTPALRLSHGRQITTASNHSHDSRSLRLDRNGAALVIARPRAHPHEAARPRNPQCGLLAGGCARLPHK
jgi:hypothetical protein